MTDGAELRAEIHELYAQRLRGDLTDRLFQRRLAERTLSLYRVLAERRLPPGERIVAEHHVVTAHLRLGETLLRETDQHAVSLFATERRLLELRSVLAADRPVTCDERDQSVWAEAPYGDVTTIRPRSQIRVGEAATGFVVALVAWALAPWLLFTSGMLVALGGLGVVHGLFLPTRWIEIDVCGRDGDPIRVLSPWRRSARRVLALVRAARAHGAPTVVRHEPTGRP